jgi:uncharacterized cupredoxin-like copper-binding protein
MAGINPPERRSNMHIRSIVFFGSIIALAAGAAWSHGGSHEKKAPAKPAQVNAEEHAFGRAGDPKKVVRTIQVGMEDSMHFTPGDLVLNRGETIKFVVRNDGKIMHEMVIGTMKELKEHAELMRKFPNMEHDEAYMAHVAPGKREEIVWQFTRAGEFYYACLIPGHLEAGMIGKIAVK